MVADDTLIFGKGDSLEEALEDHARNLEALFRRARERGLRLNREKMRLGLEEVKFMGHVISSKGLRADPEKVQAIVNISPPADVKGVQVFLGAVNYMLSFVPNLSELTEPLRRLTQNKYEFAWQSQQSEAFEKIKAMLTQAPTLAYFDSSKPITLQTDVSDHGLGGVLLQDGKPVAFTSHSLSATE